MRIYVLGGEIDFARFWHSAHKSQLETYWNSAAGKVVISKLHGESLDILRKILK